MKNVIVISSNSCWNIYNFRYGLIQALITQDYKVVIVAPIDQYANLLKRMGCCVIDIKINRKSINPFNNLRLILDYLKILYRFKPCIYLGFTIKPNISGSIAARLLGIPIITNITGLGYAFLQDNWITKLIKLLYRYSIPRAAVVFFQNDDDRSLFVSDGLVTAAQADLLPGSGIDLNKFAYTPLDNIDSFKFVLVARMLWDKGIAEYVSAARKVLSSGKHAKFYLLGDIDDGNPSAITSSQLLNWEKEGIVDYIGAKTDVRDTIKRAHCVVLPSYREGTPRSLLEACAIGRPIIASDVPGCRQLVVDEVNGFKCKVYDSDDLAEKMMKIISFSFEEIVEMGLQGRLKIEREYNEEIVIAKYLKSITSLIDKHPN